MKTLNIFIKAITFIPILTGILYITGLVRMDSFLKEFSINSQFYDVPIDRILFDGFLNIFLLSTLPVISAMYAALVLFITSTLFKEIINKPFIQKYLVKFSELFKKKTQKSNSNTKQETNHASVILSNCIIAGFVFLGLVFLILKASSIGQNDAKKLKDKISDKTEQTICLNIGDRNIEGNVLYCGSSFCGFLSGSSSLVIPISSIRLIHEDIEHCTTKNQNN